MRPVSLALALCLCAPFAGAQDDPDPEMTPPVALFRWFVGSPFNKGAYKAPKLPCSKVHDLNNSLAKSDQRIATYEGYRFYLSFLISLGANKKLCMHNDGRTIPSDAVLPTPPRHSATWIHTNASRKASDTMAAYYYAADSEDDPLAQMRVLRAKFFEAALKDVFADDEARTAICRFVDYGANCTSVIGTKSLDDLYENGRKAVAAGRELPFGERWPQPQER